ncbi:hypothetical protein EXN66_Car011975 [Channa argus]|uniref:Uncharacterized protein n=1 Tax=Channa argus TaxID=215402 RepID=A0A6G1Q216_CHAAH|nr:hypothetical protein EXN66_Car011975 [Channa argus]
MIKQSSHISCLGQPFNKQDLTICPGFQQNCHNKGTTLRMGTLNIKKGHCVRGLEIR